MAEQDMTELVKAITTEITTEIKALGPMYAEYKAGVMDLEHLYLATDGVFHDIVEKVVQLEPQLHDEGTIKEAIKIAISNELKILSIDLPGPDLLWVSLGVEGAWEVVKIVQKHRGQLREVKA